MAVLPTFTHPEGRVLTACGSGWRPDDPLATLPGHLKNRVEMAITVPCGTKKSPDGRPGTTLLTWWPSLFVNIISKYHLTANRRRSKRD